MQHRTVAELMSRNVVRARRDMPFREIVESLRDNNVTAVPVVDELDRPMGVVSEADLLRKSSSQPDPSGRTPSRDPRVVEGVAAAVPAVDRRVQRREPAAGGAERGRPYGAERGRPYGGEQAGIGRVGP